MCQALLTNDTTPTCLLLLPRVGGCALACGLVIYVLMTYQVVIMFLSNIIVNGLNYS